MDRIDKSRKGIVFGLMTEEERDCLYKQRTLKYFNNCGHWQEKENRTDRYLLSSHFAYWCDDWDEKSGVELVGKLCWVWNEDIQDTWLMIVAEYYESRYYAENETGWKYAKLASKEDALNLVTI